MIKTALIRLAKGSLIYGLGGVLQRFMGLLLLPFFTQVLTPEDYGVVALISLIGVAMSGLLSLGTGNSMGLLYYREEDHSKRPTIIWTNLLLLVVNGLFWYAIIFFLASLLKIPKQ
jgi:O-antigen/teichoic acid export membrane protein